MKRQGSFFLAALLLTLGTLAIAEQDAPIIRREVTQHEGTNETIITTYYESPLGYSMWINPEMLVLLPETDYPCDVFRFPTNPGADFCVAIQYVSYQCGDDGFLSFDNAMAAGRERFDRLYEGYAEVDTSGIFSEHKAAALASVTQGHIVYDYVVDTGDGAFYIFLWYPVEVVEGFGSDIDRMLRSFEVLPDR